MSGDLPIPAEVGAAVVVGVIRDVVWVDNLGNGSASQPEERGGAARLNI